MASTPNTSTTTVLGNQTHLWRKVINRYHSSALYSDFSNESSITTCKLLFSKLFMYVLNFWWDTNFVQVQHGHLMINIWVMHIADPCERFVIFNSVMPAGGLKPRKQNIANCGSLTGWRPPESPVTQVNEKTFKKVDCWFVDRHLLPDTSLKSQGGSFYIGFSTSRRTWRYSTQLCPLVAVHQSQNHSYNT